MDGEVGCGASLGSIRSRNVWVRSVGEAVQAGTSKEGDKGQEERRTGQRCKGRRWSSL